MIRGIALPVAAAAALILAAIGSPAVATEPRAPHPLGDGPRGDAVGEASRVDELRQHELDMLERARAERSSRAGPAPEVGTAGSTIGPTDDPGEAIRAQAIQAEVQRRLMEAEREAELDEVSARIRRSAQSRAPAQPEPPLVDMTEERAPVVNETPRSEMPAASVADVPADQSGAEDRFAEDGRATLLLVMRPGRNGIRALHATADPILCSNDVCWVSRGPDRDARMVSRRQALGPLNTLGDRAGACNGSTGCVFRNVELGGASAVVQPVDLRVIRHDKRARTEVRIDRSCRIDAGRTDAGRLDCRGQAATADYRIWAVPEATAQAAGARALMSAVGAQMHTAARFRE
jgi:hypothetical protein